MIPIMVLLLVGIFTGQNVIVYDVISGGVQTSTNSTTGLINQYTNNPYYQQLTNSTTAMNLQYTPRPTNTPDVIENIENVLYNLVSEVLQRSPSPENLPTQTTPTQVNEVKEHTFDTLNKTIELDKSIYGTSASVINATANPLHLDPLIVAAVALGVALIISGIVIKKTWKVLLIMAGIIIFIVIVFMVTGVKH